MQFQEYISLLICFSHSFSKGYARDKLHMQNAPTASASEAAAGSMPLLDDFPPVVYTADLPPNAIAPIGHYPSASDLNKISQQQIHQPVSYERNELNQSFLFGNPAFNQQYLATNNPKATTEYPHSYWGQFNTNGTNATPNSFASSATLLNTSLGSTMGREELHEEEDDDDDIIDIDDDD